MNKNFIFIIFLASFLLSGCTSGYAKFYKSYDTTDSLHQSSELVFLTDGQAPEIYGTDDFDKDTKLMVSENYVPIGESSFNGVLEDKENIMNFAKTIKAVAVLHAWKYTDTQTNSGALLLPQTNNFYGTVSGSNGFSTFNGSVSGLSATPYSITQRRYDQHAVFFIKSLKKWKIGVLFSNIPRDAKILIAHSGVIVDNIIKDSPAYKSNLLIGDIIIEIDNQQVDSAEDFLKLLAETYAANKHSIWKVIRNNKTETVRVNF